MKNKEVVESFFIECYQKHNYQFAMEHIADNYVDHSPANARSNKDAIGIMKVVESMFSDMKIEILDLIEEDDRVAARVQYSGIHTGECMGIPATGKKIQFEALEIFKIHNQVIQESWGYWPDLAIKESLQSKQV